MSRYITGKSFYKKPWFNSYRCMMSRCYREKDASFKWYGGKGIKVCDEWHDIQKFEEWVNSSNYEVGLTLDRIDSSKDYSPNNCTWSDKKKQANNKSNTIFLMFNGEIHTITEWSKITGINRSTINNRLWRGWDIADVLTLRNP